MKQEELSWKASDGLDIYGMYWSPDETPKAVICLVHGMGEHVARYQHVAEFFCERGIAMIGYDHRGHGRSGGKRGHTPSYDLLLQGVSDVMKKAEEVFPGVPQFLYGHSMGGNLVSNYALRNAPSVKGVMISSPYLRLAFEPPKFKVGLAKFVGGFLPGLVQSTELDASAISRDKAVVDKYVNDPLVHDKVSVAFFLGIHEAGEWAVTNAAALKVPALIFHGTGDQITSHLASEEFAQKAGDAATLKLWEGLYHECHNEPEQQQVLEAMYEWVNGKLA